MLKLLLDEHISPEVAGWFRGRHNKLVVLSLVEWEEGRFLGQADELLLKEAAAQKLTLVTYDRRTIPPLLKLWAEEGRSHGGVIFVDEKTISPADLGGLVRALSSLAAKVGEMDWTNQVYFLRSVR